MQDEAGGNHRRRSVRFTGDQEFSVPFGPNKIISSFLFVNPFRALVGPLLDGDLCEGVANIRMAPSDMAQM